MAWSFYNSSGQLIDGVLDDTVTTAKIANNAVTGAKLNPSLVAGDLIVATGTDTIDRLAKGAANHVLTMNDGATAPNWEAPAAGGIASVAADSTPELGGPLDVVTHDIVSTSNRNIDITPHGTGATVLNGEVKGSRAFVSLLTDLLEGGSHSSLFWLGPHSYDPRSTSNNNDQCGFGNAFKLEISGSGSRTLMSQQAGLRGKAWQIDSGASDGRRTVLYAGGQVMAFNDDWTIVMRYQADAGSHWGFGLISNPANAYPWATASYNTATIYGETGSALPKLRTHMSSAAYETQLTGSYNFSNIHVAKLDISEGGRYVKAYMDGTLFATHDANISGNRVPQGQENFFLYLNMSSYGGNVRTIHVSDFIAYTEA